MKTLVLVFMVILVSTLAFVGIEALQGSFTTLGSVFSTEAWASMSAVDTLIYLACLFVAMQLIKIRD